MEKGLGEAKIACQRLGTEQLEGKAVTVYAAHVEKEDSVSDNELWIGSNGLPLPVETVLEGPDPFHPPRLRPCRPAGRCRSADEQAGRHG